MKHGNSAWLAAFCAVVLMGAAQGAVLLSDNFDDVASGTNLNGTTPDIGIGTWASGNSSNKLKGDGAGAVTSVGTGGSQSGMSLLQFTNQANYVATDTLELLADFNFGTLTGTGPKAVLGFTTVNTGKDSYNWPLMFRVQADGGWALQKSGTNLVANTAGNKVTAGSAWHTLKVQYVPGTTAGTATINVWWDTTQLVSNYSATGLSTLTYAGLGDDSAANLLADNFVLQSTPEPATLALLCSGMGLVAFRRRK